MTDKNDSPNNNKKYAPPTRDKVRNPFDKVLIERLHEPICSPGMCKMYKTSNNGSFKWDIDQACTLVPADIVACISQFEPSPDTPLEKIAEEANKRFFSQEMVMPSPLETTKKVKPLQTSSDGSNLIITSFINENTTSFREAQTVLTLPLELPPELEKILEPFCTYTQEHDLFGEYEVTANGSLRRKLYFEEHVDMEHDESEQTDDEVTTEQRPPSTYEVHTPVLFSPDLSCDLVARGMKRTSCTPLQEGQINKKPCYRNKILDVVDFGEPCFSPVVSRTPKGSDQITKTPFSFASTSISPITKVTSSDEEVLGQQRLRCNKASPAVTSPPAQRDVHCHPLPIRRGQVARTTNTQLGTEIKFSCTNGNALLGVQILGCRDSGNWSAPLRVYESVECGAELLGAALVEGERRPRVAVLSRGVGGRDSFSCPPGWALDDPDGVM